MSGQINEPIPDGDKQEVEVAGLGWVTHLPHAYVQRRKENVCGGSLSTTRVNWFSLCGSLDVHGIQVIILGNKSL